MKRFNELHVEDYAVIAEEKAIKKIEEIEDYGFTKVYYMSDGTSYGENQVSTVHEAAEAFMG
jgi:hypothetical protein